MEHSTIEANTCDITIIELQKKKKNGMPFQIDPVMFKITFFKSVLAKNLFLFFWVHQIQIQINQHASYCFIFNTVKITFIFLSTSLLVRGKLYDVGMSQSAP